MTLVRWIPLLLIPAACSTDGTRQKSNDPCSRGCPDRSGFDLTTPTTTFAADVYPILAANCTQAACHGSGASAKAALELGPPERDPTPEEITAAYETLNRASVTVNTMSLVAPANPNASFLMLKIEGCQNGASLDCTQILPNACNAPCGEPMPPLPAETYPTLDEQEKLTIRRWIAQGAVP